MANYGKTQMPTEWSALSDEVQLALSREALCHAAETFASQAEVLAGEIDDGSLADRGGADALRLLAAVVRVAGRGNLHEAAGHA